MDSIASSILFNSGITIGSWNELKSIKPERHESLSFIPGKDAFHLYVCAKKLAKWMRPKNHFLIQIDNSTSALDGELDVFSKIIQKPLNDLDIYLNRTYVISREDDISSIEATLSMLINFMILFCWHIHLVPDNSKNGRRISIQDGVVYIFGGDDIAGVNKLMDEMKK